MDTMPQTELATTDHTTPNNSQNAPPTIQKKQEVTLELRKYILLLASLVATVTYAAGFSPPGGVWQDTAAGHLAGDPIIRDTHHKRYVAFFYCNATAFAASLVVIVIILILAYLDDKQQEPNSKGDKKEKETNSKVACFLQDDKKKHRIALRTLQAAMVLDLLSLMGAYSAGTCRDTFTTIYSSLLVSIAFAYLVIQMAMASCSTGSGSGGREEVQERLPVPDKAVASVPGENPDAGSGAVMTGVKEEDQRKVEERFRKILMLLATFAVSITYLAGLSTPGGFWDSDGSGHHPSDAILKDHHSTRLAVFFGFNTTAFVASLLIIVVLLDKKLHEKNAYFFIIVALVSLIGAYNAGSCRQTDTTVYVFSLIAAVLLCILFLLMVTRAVKLEEPPTPSTPAPVVPQQAMGASDGRKNANGRYYAELLPLKIIVIFTTFNINCGCTHLISL
jgi:NADH:ubiquinone oxidoreductase subunit 5 (subunit L)/multisubunit Na+/H+ antiporter MnhA subunit